MDPYKVLGVAPDATDEQVKAAYRDLARKYHPDNYANNPLADLAQEKMKQINEAYDTITKQRKAAQGNQSASYQQGSGSYQYGQYGQRSGAGSTQFADIRRLIMQRRIVEAEELLDGVPSGSRNGEWYFLKGNILYNKGWLDEAYRYFSKACQLEPGNQEYQNAMQQIAWQRGNGRPTGYGYGGTVHKGKGTDVCDIFNTLICADCCCECMGGDLIGCC